MTKRALIFDFGGVITRTIDYTPRNQWDERLNLPHGSVEKAVHGSQSWIKAQLGAISLDAYWADVAQQLNLSPDQTQQLADDFYRGDALNTAMVEFIRERREAGHAVALLSNFGMMLATALVDLGIRDLFDPCVISAEIGVMKPEPAAYQAVLDRLGQPPDNCIFIDDSPANVTAAQNMGIHAIHFTPELDFVAAITPLLQRG